jgi:hypothetical protein
MFYHFKLLNHFTGRDPINLPFYFHKTLTKMARQVKVKPTKVASRLSHQGLITLLIKESLKKKQVAWNYFLFWNEFQTDKPQEDKGKKTATRKAITPKSSQRKRRAISPLKQQAESSSAKKKRTKRKLQFEEGEKAEGLAMEDNPLNLPYSDSEHEPEHNEAQGEQQTDIATDEYPNLPTPTPPEEQNQSSVGASSRKPKASRTQKVRKLLQQTYEMEVLIRVIKKSNTDLTERNAELFKINQTLKEKHDKIKDRNRVLIRENMKLYRQLRILRLKLKESQSPAQEKTSLETLANLATTMVDTPEPSTQPVEVRRSARTRAASSKKP